MERSSDAVRGASFRRTRRRIVRNLRAGIRLLAVILLLLTESDPGRSRASPGAKNVPADAPPQVAPEQRRNRLPLLVLGGLALLVLAIVGGVSETARTRASLVDPHGDTRCRRTVGDRQAVTGRKAGAYTLSPRTPDQIHRLAFGTSRQPEFVSIEFTQTGGRHDPNEIDRVLRTQVSEFQRTDGRKFHNPSDQIWAQAIVGARDRVNLLVCLDPGRGRRVIPGTYVGTVAVDDDSLAEPAVASIQVTLKYPDMWGPLILVAAGALAAIALKAASDATTRTTVAWLGRPTNRAALVYGIAAAAAVYAAYLRSDDWGANGLLDMGALFAAGFAGFLARLTAHQAGTNAGRGESGGRPEAGSGQAGGVTKPSGPPGGAGA
jgi:hypothetical protein